MIDQFEIVAVDVLLKLTRRRLSKLFNLPCRVQPRGPTSRCHRQNPVRFAHVADPSRTSPEVRELKSEHWLSLWRSSGEILNHGCKSLRSDFHRAGERIIDCHNGQQPGKD